jgi:hypothetical protein
VASAALLMKGVGSLRHFLIAFVQLVAFAARPGICIFILFKRVMAITARYTIPVDIEMLFVLEDDIAGRNFKLQPDRLTG